MSIVFPENSSDMKIQIYNKPFGSRENGTDYTSTFSLDAPLPKNFSWHIITNQDDEARKIIKERILKPHNQGKCGNCFAFAVADVLSDLFLVKYGLAQNPNISPSYINAHYPDLGACAGGNPVVALKAIVKDGVVSRRCVDDSVCLTHPDCNGKNKTNAPTSQLNKLYTSIGDGCYKNVGKEHKLYFPSIEDSGDPYFKVYPNYDTELSKEILQGATKVEEFVKSADPGLESYPSHWKILRHDQVEMMTQIYRNGPVVGMMIVLNTLMEPFYENPDFNDIFDGIVFDSIIWEGNKSGHYTYQNPQLVNCGLPKPEGYKLKFDGGHGVSVVGYGVSTKEIPLMDFKSNKLVKVKNIPFWWVRNSWSEKWNNQYKGFFKLAMYPFNKVMQMDIPLGEKEIDHIPATVPAPYTKRGGIGGMLIVEAGNITDFKNYTSNNYFKQNPDFTDKSKYIHYDDPDWYTTTSQVDIIKNGVRKNSKGITMGTIRRIEIKKQLYISLVIAVVSALIIFCIVNLKN